MSLNNDPLAAYRVASEKKEPQKQKTEETLDPLDKYRQEGKKRTSFRDVVSENLRAQGVEPDFSEELERAAAIGGGEALKSVVSGATFGASRAIPGFRPEEGVTSGIDEAIGSTLLPIGSAIKAGKYAFSPLVKLAEKSPKIQKAISSLGHLTGISALGATGGAIHEATEDEELKLPSIENALEHGATWGAIDIALNALGYSGRFVKSLLSKSKSLGKDKISLLTDTIQQAESIGGSDEKVAKTALDILEGNSPKNPYQISQEKLNKEALERSQNLKKKKIDVKDYTKLKNTPKKPYLPGEFQFNTVVEEAVNSDIESSLESISERAPSEKKLGENVINDIENQTEIRANRVSDLYSTASEGEELKNANLQSTANAIFEQLQRIRAGNIKLSPEGYTKADKQLLQALEDIGYSPVFEEEGTKLKEVVKTSDTPLSKAIEIKRRLNKIIDYDLKETGAQDFLKNPTHSLRQDIREGYGSKDSPQRLAFEEAEKLHGENAERLKKKSISSTRYSEKPESVAKLIKTPSGLHDLKETVSPDQFKQIEREVLEHIKNLPEEKATSFYREIKGDLSSEAKIVAEEIIESKAPPNSISRKEAQTNKIRDSVLDDISKASITGERPEKALNLWKTKKGQQIIKHSLEGNPNKKEIIDYLSDTSFNDFSSSVINPSGEINFKKLSEFMKDPSTVETIRLVAGEEGVNLFRNLENISKEAKKNFSIIEGVIDKGSASERAKLEKSIASKSNRFERHKELQKEGETPKNELHAKLENLLKSYGTKLKGALAILGVYKFGPVDTLAVGTAYETLKYLAKNKKVRQALRQASAPHQSPENILKAYEALDKATSD